jgi:ribosomal protein S18 acetylase RimI-like enzyme
LGSSFAKSFYLQFLYDSAATCVIAEDTEGNIIGCGTAKVVWRDLFDTIERDGHILTLAVDPNWRRRGIGRDILEVWTSLTEDANLKALVLQLRTVCARLSKQKGQSIMLKSVVLQANARNLPALKFYEGCGYQRQALKAGYYGGV